jgi:hypothetical protein
MMSATFRSRALAGLGLLLACSCWFTAAFLFGALMGERVGEDAADQARIDADQRLWAVVLLGAWLTGLVASAAIAGFTLRTQRVISLLTLSVLLAFVIVAVVWGS